MPYPAFRHSESYQKGEPMKERYDMTREVYPGDRVCSIITTVYYKQPARVIGLSQWQFEYYPTYVIELEHNKELIVLNKRYFAFLDDE